MMKQWYETNEQYKLDDALAERQWPKSLALVRVNTEDSKTQAGWGRTRFAKNHERSRFDPDRVIDSFVREERPFGFVMRSLPMVCVDIDGKNGGIQASRILRLTPTLAERSKSGNGYHLFYRVPEAVWNPAYGYEEFNDANGILPGVDIRAVGIVYHYPQQRWNELDIASIPNSLRRLLAERKHSQERERARKAVPLDGDDLAIAQEQTLERLAGSIPTGKRNQTLFAIGCDLRLYNVPDWPDLLIARGSQLGLPLGELKEVVRHVKRYS